VGAWSWCNALTKGKKMKVITAEYDAWGYTVFVAGVEAYSAGGNAHASQAPGRSPPRNVRRWAMRSAKEIAEEVDGVVGEIVRRADLVRRDE